MIGRGCTLNQDVVLVPDITEIFCADCSGGIGTQSGGLALSDGRRVQGYHGQGIDCDHSRLHAGAAAAGAGNSIGVGTGDIGIDAVGVSGRTIADAHGAIGGKQLICDDRSLADGKIRSISPTGGGNSHRGVAVALAAGIAVGGAGDYIAIFIVERLLITGRRNLLIPGHNRPAAGRAIQGACEDQGLIAVPGDGNCCTLSAISGLNIVIEAYAIRVISDIKQEVYIISGIGRAYVIHLQISACFAIYTAKAAEGISRGVNYCIAVLIDMYIISRAGGITTGTPGKIIPWARVNWIGDLSKCRAYSQNDYEKQPDHFI